jgi:hypothetical protein
MDKKVPAHIRNHLTKHQHSKLTIKAYCKKTGINTNTFYGWSNRYRKQVLTEKKDTFASPVTFAPLGVLSTQQIQRIAMFEIRFPDGTAISVYPGITAEEIAPFIDLIKGSNGLC